MVGDNRKVRTIEVLGVSFSPMDCKYSCRAQRSPFDLILHNSVGQSMGQDVYGHYLLMSKCVSEWW